MSFKYSTSQQGFYHPDMNSTIPDDAKDITDDQYEALFEKQQTIGGKIVFPDDGGLPTFEAETAPNAITQLREHRDFLLKETDWMAGKDVSAISTAWKNYRQALRDLPANADPKIADDGGLGTSVTWPTKPS